MCSNSLLYIFFPIRLIYKVLKEKNYMLIPFYQAWGSLFMSISWIIYGILISEIYVVIPHCFNIILATMQIVLYLNFKKNILLLVIKILVLLLELKIYLMKIKKKKLN